MRGLAAYRELLLTHPEWRGQVTHLAFAYPSRHDLPEYREYTAQVQRMAADINDEFGTDAWDPLILDVNDDYPRSLAAYRLADVLLVNPIRDGMNLVAKEGPILAERGCALVLSTEAGAAAELGAARTAGQPVRRHADRRSAAPGAAACRPRSAPAGARPWPRPPLRCRRPPGSRPSWTPWTGRRRRTRT